MGQRLANEMDKRKAFEQLIDNYLKGLPLSEEERELLDSYFDAFEEGDNVLKSLPDEQVNRIKTQLAQRIGIEGRTKRTINLKRYLRWAAGVAAAIAVYFFVANPPYGAEDRLTDARSLAGGISYRSTDSTKQVLLPDGSLVFLNKESTLNVSADFGRESRTVSLIGEGYFDIAHDTMHPFIVRCGDMDVEVLGTTFVAKSAADEQSVGLLSGNVKLRLPSQQVALAPGEFAARTTGGSVKKERKDIAALLSWKPAAFELLNITMTELASFMSKRYNLHLEFENDNLKTCRITHSWTGEESWRELLDVVGLVNRFDYTVKGNQVIIAGAGCTPIDH